MKLIEKERKELQVEHEKKLLILTEREKVCLEMFYLFLFLCSIMCLLICIYVYIYSFTFKS